MNISLGLERREREERDRVSEDIHQTLNLRERGSGYGCGLSLVIVPLFLSLT